MRWIDPFLRFSLLHSALTGSSLMSMTIAMFLIRDLPLPWCVASIGDLQLRNLSRIRTVRTGIVFAIPAHFVANGIGCHGSLIMHIGGVWCLGDLVLLSMMCTAARISLWSNLFTRSVARCDFHGWRTDGWWSGFIMATSVVLGMVNCCGGPPWPTSGQQVVRIRSGSLG